MCYEVANSTLSATRLRQRLVVARRYFMALSRHKPQETKDVSSTSKPTSKLQKMYNNQVIEIEVVELFKRFENITRVYIARVTSV